MAIVTVADVLASSVLQRGRPRLLAGEAGLDRPVRWVHSGELADIAPLLRDGDLLLSTGIAMPDSPVELRAVASSLAASGAAGLVIELGRRWKELPAELVAVCEAHDLPLIVLDRETRFAEVAQAVGERIVDEHLSELREAQRVHDTFTDLSIAEAGPTEILDALHRLAATTVVVESEQHQVLDYRGADAALDAWAAESRGIDQTERTVWDAETQWLITQIGKPERGWGRVFVKAAERPAEHQIAMIERAAAALALDRLYDRQRESATHRAHHELLISLLTDPTAADLAQRCEVAGLPTTRRQLVGVTVRLRDATTRKSLTLRTEELTAAAVHAAHEVRVPALVSDIDGDVRILLSLAASSRSDRIVDEIATRIHRRHPVAISSGRPVVELASVDQTLREATQVINALRSEDADRRIVHRLDDVGLRGLLSLLDGDDRLALFAQRQLRALREHDGSTNDDLEAAVRALLAHPTSKSEAAASIHLSRPAFYDRLAKAGRVLGADLDDAEVRATLQVALLADDLRRS